jgi:hypothetical protein
MASVADIRAGLAGNLTTAGFTNVNAYTLANPNPPQFELDLAGGEYDLAFNRGVDLVTMTVRLILGDASDRGAQEARDTYLEAGAATDVKAALESDRTLGGAAHTLHVTGWSPRRWRSETTGNLQIGVEWTVVVHA